MPKEIDKDKLRAEFEEINSEIRSAYDKLARKFHKQMELAREKANHHKNEFKRSVQLRRFELYGNAIEEVGEIARRYDRPEGDS